LKAQDHDAIVRLQAAFDQAELTEGLTELDPTLLDHVVGIDHEQIAAALVASKGYVGDQQPLNRARGHTHSDEITWQQGKLGVLERAAHLQRARRGRDSLGR
jgi:hypothetical protein